MAQFPSRSYVTPRTRFVRRIYFAGAVAAVILITVITLYSLSDKTETPEPQQEPRAVASQPKAQPKAPAAQMPARLEQKYETPPRFSMSLDLNEPAKTQAKPQPPVTAEPQLNPAIETTPLETTPAETAVTQIPPTSEPPAVQTDPTAAADAQAQAVIDEAMSIINARPMEIIKARDMLNELLGKPISSAKRSLIKQELSKLADRWLFSQTVYPKDPLCSLYNVQSGDLLSTIGSKYKVPWEILLQINQIPSPQSLQAGQTIKVINGPFHAKIFRSTFTMDLYLQDTFVRNFPVGLGKADYETPTGLWVVRPGGKLIKPRWTDPDTGKTYEADDPDYPLGSRWISLDGLEGAAVGRTGFAIHGTKDPHEIGSAKSRGCIRLYNGDVILVYDLLMPGESKVLVTD